jgi:CRISPR/Cas system-associated endoribonuclease Cas2
MTTHNYIIAYDIFDPKRLRKVKEIVYSYSLGGQKSAIEAPLDRQNMKMLITELSGHIEQEDKINIIRVIDKPILLGRASHIAYEQNGVIIL